MVQSIQAGSTALYNLATSFLGAGKLTTGEAQKNNTASQDQDETVTTSSQGDTLTISDAGALAAKTFTAQSANRPSVDGLTDEGYTDSTAAAISSAAADAGITEYTSVKNANAEDSAAVSSGSSSGTSSADSDLSQYSLSELKEMLEDGEITQAEYNAEIQSRQTGSTASDEQDDGSSVAGSGKTEE